MKNKTNKNFNKKINILGNEHKNNEEEIIILKYKEFINLSHYTFLNEEKNINDEIYDEEKGNTIKNSGNKLFHNNDNNNKNKNTFKKQNSIEDEL